MIVLALHLCSSAHASQFARFDRRQQVNGCDLIVRGRVAAVSSHWDAAGASIYTDAAVGVEEVWKGMAPPEGIVVRSLGGTVGNIRLAVDGAPEFSPGEEVVLFLRRAAEVYAPWGMVFGTYRVVGPPDMRLAVGFAPPSRDGSAPAEPVTAQLSSLRSEIVSIVRQEVR